MDVWQIPVPWVGVICLSVVFTVAFAPNFREIAPLIGITSVSHGSPDIPVIGVRKEWFAWPRAILRSILHSEILALEGYTKYSTFNIPYLLPTIDRGPMVLIPPKHAKEVYGVPETRLDFWDTINASIQTNYTIQDHHITEKALHWDVLRNQITRNLAILTEPLEQELDNGFRNWWGVESQWKRIPVFDSCLNIVASAANVAFLGPSLCRNQLFLRRLKTHATTVFSGGIVINVMPGPLKHITGLVFRALCRYHSNKVLKLCLPLVEDRLGKTLRWLEGVEPDWNPPNDGLQWMIQEAISKEDPTELHTRRLSERILFLNDVSMHTSAFTLQALLQNLALSDPRDNIIQTLREECRSVLGDANGQWTFKAVQKLILLDSTIRESMRMSTFSIFGLPRTVIDPNGISVQSNEGSYFLPNGSIVALPVQHAHYDEQVYRDAHKFQPFRFVPVDNVSPTVKAQASTPIAKTAVTLDEHFLAFGHGKHGCPGRFFVIHEIKLMMANILLNYDIEPLESRKELINIMWLKLPLNNLTLRVRRRASSQTE